MMLTYIQEYKLGRPYAAYECTYKGLPQPLQCRHEVDTQRSEPTESSQRLVSAGSQMLGWWQSLSRV